jgi:hypothetical protein
VLAFVLHGGRGKRSGMEAGQIQNQGAVLFELHARKVVHMVAYFERARALADLPER